MSRIFTTGENKPAVRSCRTCRFFDQHWIKVADEHRLDERCYRHHRYFPDATYCGDYEREPGSDDE